MNEPKKPSPFGERFIDSAGNYVLSDQPKDEEEYQRLLSAWFDELRALPRPDKSGENAHTNGRAGDDGSSAQP